LNEYIFEWNLGIDEFIFRDAADAIGTSNSGRMAPNTALNFALVGIAFIIYTFQSLRNKFIVDFMVSFSLTISVMGLLGYATGLMGFAGIGDAVLTKMSLSTSITFILLSVGMLSTLYESQSRYSAIKQKLFSGLAVIFTVIVFVSFFYSSNVKSMSETNQLVSQLQKTNQELDFTLSDMADLESSTSSFIIDGDNSYLESMKMGKQKLSVHLFHLKTLASNTETKLSLDTLSRLANKYIIYNDKLVDLH